MYDVLTDFKARAVELLVPKGEYFGGVYVMNLSREAGFGVVKLHSCSSMMSALAESVSRFTARAVGVAFIGCRVCDDVDEWRVMAMKNRALLLLAVDEDNKFSAWRRDFRADGWKLEWHIDRWKDDIGDVAITGPWIDITADFKDCKEPEIMVEIRKNNSFDLSAVGEIRGAVKADATII